jgi:hypothetical protein
MDSMKLCFIVLFLFVFMSAQYQIRLAIPKLDSGGIPLMGYVRAVCGLDAVREITARPVVLPDRSKMSVLSADCGRNRAVPGDYPVIERVFEDDVHVVSVSDGLANASGVSVFDLVFDLVHFHAPNIRFSGLL